VIEMFAWPMYVLSAFAVTPVAIISDANVCRHSCRVIGLSDFGSNKPKPALQSGIR